MNFDFEVSMIDCLQYKFEYDARVSYACYRTIEIRFDSLKLSLT